MALKGKMKEYDILKEKDCLLLSVLLMNCHELEFSSNHTCIIDNNAIVFKTITQLIGLQNPSVFL